MDTLHKIERIVDDHHRSNPLFRLSLPIFILKLLEVVETEIFIISEKTERIIGIAGRDFFLQIGAVLSGASQCIKWAFQNCHDEDNYEMGRFCTEEEYPMFVDLLFEASKYMDLSEEFTRSHKGQTCFELIDEDTFRFFRKREQHQYEKLNQYYIGKKSAEAAAQFILFTDENVAEMSLKTMINFRKKVEDHYEMDKNDFLIAIRVFIDQANTWWNIHNKIPEEWEFDDISVREFKQFVVAVFALNLFEIGASHLENANKYDRLYTPVFITMDFKLVNDIKMIYPNMEDSSIIYCLNMLTINNHLDDPLNCCPFIKLSNLIVTTPHILSMLPAGEALMHHIPRDDRKYSKLTNEKEKIQGNSIIKGFQKHYDVIFMRNVSLPKPYPDIDLLIYSEVDCSLLLLELKWFSGVVTVGKQCNKINSDIQRAVEQLNRVSEYIERLGNDKLIEYLHNRGMRSESKSGITKIQYVVVVDGIPDVYNDKYSILSMNTMNRIFDNAKNFNEAVEYIRSKKFLIANNTKHISSFYKIDYAEKTFEIPCYEEYHHVGRNEPCPCGERKNNGERKKYKDCCLKDRTS